MSTFLLSGRPLKIVDEKNLLRLLGLVVQLLALVHHSGDVRISGLSQSPIVSHDVLPCRDVVRGASWCLFVILELDDEHLMMVLNLATAYGRNLRLTMSCTEVIFGTMSLAIR